MTRKEMIAHINEVIAADKTIDHEYIRNLYDVDLKNPEACTTEQLENLINAWADFDKGFE